MGLDLISCSDHSHMYTQIIMHLLQGKRHCVLFPVVNSRGRRDTCGIFFYFIIFFCSHSSAFFFLFFLTSLWAAVILSYRRHFLLLHVSAFWQVFLAARTAFSLSFFLFLFFKNKSHSDTHTKKMSFLPGSNIYLTCLLNITVKEFETIYKH